MPTSNLRPIGDLVERIVAADPMSLLHVGVGFGKPGVLTREHLMLRADRPHDGS